MIFTAIFLAALAAVQGVVAVDDCDEVVYTWNMSPGPSFCKAPPPVFADEQSDEDIQAKSLVDFAKYYETNGGTHVDVFFMPTLLAKNRAIMFRFIDKYEQPIHRIGTLEGDIALSVYWWGFIVEFSNPSDKFHCSVSVGQIAKNLRSQIHSLRLIVMEKDPSHTENEYLGLAMMIQSAIIENVGGICEKSISGLHVGALWATPNVMHLFSKKTINRHDSSLFSFSVEELILGTIISLATYEASNADALASFEKAVPLFPNVLTSRFVEVEQLDSRKITFARTEDSLIVGFRGTYTKTEWLNNVNGEQVARNISGVTCHFHRGFEKNFRQMRPFFYKHLHSFLERMAAGPFNKPLKSIIFAGHSMGGAMATYGTFELFHDILPDIFSKYPAIARYLVSVENVREKFHGIIVAAPPTGDVAFADMFATYRLDFYNFYAWSDKMPNLIYHWGGIADRETANLSKWEGAYWMRKIFSKYWKYPWKHVGRRIRTEDFVSPTLKFKKSAWRFLLPDWWSYAKRSHELDSYMDGARKLLHIADFSSAATTRLLYPGDKFRIFSLQHQKYCTPHYEHEKNGGFLMECDASLETAKSMPFMAANIDIENVMDGDISPISLCSNLALVSVMNDVHYSMRANLITTEVFTKALQQQKDVEKFRIHLGFNMFGNRRCATKHVERFGKTLVLRREKDKHDNISFERVVFLDLKGPNGLRQLYTKNAPTMKVARFWSHQKKDDSALFRIEMDDEILASVADELEVPVADDEELE